MSQQDVIHSYRHLLRCLLRAVQFSKPARFPAVEQLRAAFREKGATYNADGIRRTRWFLEAAARERGLEHRILKNLLRVHVDRKRLTTVTWKPKRPEAATEGQPIWPDAYHHYDKTVEMLNYSMGTLLR